MRTTKAESPTMFPDDNLVPLESVLCTEELNRRPARPPDYETENRALVTLAQALTDSPRTILQKMAEIMLETFRADSAGFSLLTKDDGGRRFHWPAIAGVWKPHIGGGTPREFGPCGDVLDRNAPLLFRHFERRYTYFLPVTPPAEECLLVPFYVEGKAVGTIWAITHDDRRKFDAEDMRQLVSLGRFASSAYQAMASLDALGEAARTDRGQRRAALNLMEDAVQSRQAIESLNAELRASEERFRALFELGPVAVFSCNREGVIQNYNHRAAEIWGRKPICGDPAERFCGSLKLYHPDGRILLHKNSPIVQVLETGVVVKDAEVLIERPDGSRVAVVVTFSPLKNQRGETTGAITAFYDITERKQAEAKQRRLEVLAASNRKLKQEIARRQAVEESLKQTQGQQSRLLEQSRQMQEQLRHLSHQLLSAQEDERKRISRELHDVIAQTLTSINLRLATLKKEFTLSPKGMERSIARTQELVAHSVDIVHRFARELRPTVLDDLGLIPALHTFVKNFKEQTGIHVSLSAFSEVEQVNGDKRTVLYRVAQEALTNVARHAQASRAEVLIQKHDNVICMEIKDNGKGFPPERMLHAKKNKRLGLLGMRERVQMVRGSFTVKSALGKSTSILVQIPLAENGDKGFVPAAPARNGSDHPAPEGPVRKSVRRRVSQANG